MNEQTQQSPNWWESLKEAFLRETKKFDLSVHNLVEIFAYAAVGFITGFLLKKYGRFLILFFLIAVLSLWGLNYLNIITIDIVKIKTLLGISEFSTVDSIWKTYSFWVKEHIIATITILIGFLIGYHVG